MITNYKMTNYKLKQMIRSSGFKKLLVILILFIGYLSLTLTYSSNPVYGFQKILNFVISIVPSVLVFYYLISTLTELRIKLFIYSIIVITLLSVSYILIDYPFDQSTIYEFKPGRWSHVIYGRMISSFAVVLLLYIVWMIEGSKTRLLPKKLNTLGQVRDTARQAKEERQKVLFLMFITSIAIYGTYLSALRAAFVGLMLVGVLIISVFVLLWFRNIWASKITPDKSAWFAVRGFLQRNLFICRSIKSGQTKNKEPAYRTGRRSTKKMYHTNDQKSPVSGVLSTILIITILTALLIIFIPKPDIINFRFDNMTAIDDLQFKGDPAIHYRLEAWNLSLDIIKKYPILGTGLGGFKGYNGLGWTIINKYPHNLFLEMFVETGIIGLFILFSLLFFLFKYSYQLSKFTFIFLLFALFLSMFSKDIATQSVLWLGFVFVGLDREELRSKEIKFGNNM